MLNLKLPDSKSIIARIAACSPGVETPYVVNALMMAGAACAAVAHSDGNAAPSHDAVSGAAAMMACVAA